MRCEMGHMEHESSGCVEVECEFAELHVANYFEIDQPWFLLNSAVLEGCCYLLEREKTLPNFGLSWTSNVT